MSSEAKAVIEEFGRLPRLDQLAVYEAIARKVSASGLWIHSQTDDLTQSLPNLFHFVGRERRTVPSRGEVWI